MIELGYLEQTKKGIHDRQGRKDGTSGSRLTRYRATNRLIDKFTAKEQEVLSVVVPPQEAHAPIRIRIKNQEGRREVFAAPVTEETVRMSANLAQINRVLATQWYDLQISDEELTDLQTRLADDPNNPRPLSFFRRSLHRVFNDGKLTTGGRFYGVWWQNIPKEYRRHLIVDGKRMVEIDYSNLHPVILYAEAGAVPPLDCYKCIFDAVTERAGGEDLRNMVKAALNAMLNAERELRHAPRGIDPAEFELKWREVSDAILLAHRPIAHFFYTGAGKRLQRRDSDVAERVMLNFIEYGYPILPVHDSFLVHEGHRGLLEERMRAALKEVCGITTRLKLVEPVSQLVLNALNHDQGPDVDADIFGPPTTDDLRALLASLQGHDRRLNAFYCLM